MVKLIAENTCFIQFYSFLIFKGSTLEIFTPNENQMKWLVLASDNWALIAAPLLNFLVLIKGLPEKFLRKLSHNLFSFASEVTVNTI